MRRKQWEAKVLSNTIVSALFGDGSTSLSGTASRKTSTVSHEEFMMAMGAKWQ